MTVGELIEVLENVDPEAKVLMGCQPRWPFEYACTGVTVRGAFKEEEDIRGDENSNDVILLQGNQLRYGDEVMWDHAIDERGWP